MRLQLLRDTEIDIAGEPQHLKAGAVIRVPGFRAMNLIANGSARYYAGAIPVPETTPPPPAPTRKPRAKRSKK